MPITSPVDRISGPRMGSTPGNLAKRKIACFTVKKFGTISSVTPCSCNDWPAMHFAAILANDIPVAFAIKGTVREARGFASIT